jgi:hypothetical protein
MNGHLKPEAGKTQDDSFPKGYDIFRVRGEKVGGLTVPAAMKTQLRGLS